MVDLFHWIKSDMIYYILKNETRAGYYSTLYPAGLLIKEGKKEFEVSGDFIRKYNTTSEYNTFKTTFERLCPNCEIISKEDYELLKDCSDMVSRICIFDCDQFKFPLKEKVYYDQKEGLLVSKKIYKNELFCVVRQEKSEVNVPAYKITRLNPNKETFYIAESMPTATMSLPPQIHVFGVPISLEELKTLKGIRNFKIPLNSEVIVNLPNEESKKGILKFTGNYNGEILHGVELSEQHPKGTNGKFYGRTLFYCKDKHGVLVLGSMVQPFENIVKTYTNAAVPDNKNVKHQSRQFFKADLLDDEDIFQLDKADLSHLEEYIELCQIEEESAVEVKFDGLIPAIVRYGTLKGIYYHRYKRSVWVGVELDNVTEGATDGTFGRRQLFKCSDSCGVLAPAHLVKHDTRFDFGNHLEEPKRDESIIKQSSESLEGEYPVRFEYTTNKWRGIQGQQNSCYLDATLFSMFAYNETFDHLLHRNEKIDSQLDNDAKDVREILRTKILNNLRANQFVPHKHIMDLRNACDRYGKIKGMTSEEKDPEEFLNLLFENVLKAEFMLSYDTNIEANLFQLFLEPPELLKIPTTQQLVELAFFQNETRLNKIPPVMVFQMPRYGSAYKMFNRIRQSPYLSITNLIKSNPKRCFWCPKAAEYECKECFKITNSLSSTFLCKSCMDEEHSVSGQKHNGQKLEYDPVDSSTNLDVFDVEMELFAVMCIETSHYVSFVKCGHDRESPWLFFDSMAHRYGTNDNAYNVPEVSQVKNFMSWLEDENTDWYDEPEPDKELKRRLMCDSYMSFYRNPIISLYG